jgi:uncharacterized protein (TIGR01319 family)
MINVCIDIGSTWTKGAAFEIDGDAVMILRRAATPTTVCNLREGFSTVLNTLLRDNPLAQLKTGRAELYYSSSAKGGLAVAAIGLVPEITLEVGKVAAQSAGAKLTQVFSYQLTHSDVAALEAAPPDILLFAGGTDGGNTNYVLANAEAIGRSAIDCEIVYAGNRTVADEVADRLRNKRLRIVDNLLPRLDEPDPDPAREAIRAVFLETIVKGKGLTDIMEMTGAAPVPTPLAMFEYAHAIREHVAGWQNMLLIDMGGATTDVYTTHFAAHEAGTIMRGLPEPMLKRTVEGDLGLRVSAQSASRANGAATQALLARRGMERETLIHHANALARQPDVLANGTQEQELDAVLADICVGHACARHAGRHTSVFTPEGEMQIQTGRDLRRIDKMIGSGGWLAQTDAFSPADRLADHAIDARGRRVLLPRKFDYYRDEAYLFPLLANLARAHPRAAAHAGIAALKTG